MQSGVDRNCSFNVQQCQTLVAKCALKQTLKILNIQQVSFFPPIFLYLNIPEYVRESQTKCNIDQTFCVYSFTVMKFHFKWAHISICPLEWGFFVGTECKGSWVAGKLCHGHRLFGCYLQSAPDQRENRHVWKAWIQTQRSTGAEYEASLCCTCKREILCKQIKRQTKPITANTIWWRTRPCRWCQRELPQITHVQCRSSCKSCCVQQILCDRVEFVFCSVIKPPAYAAAAWITHRCTDANAYCLLCNWWLIFLTSIIGSLWKFEPCLMCCSRHLSIDR